MRRTPLHGALAATLLSASLGAIACHQGDDAASQTGFHTEAAIEAVPADEELGSTALRQAICDAIVLQEGDGAHGGECTGFTYTITEFARSTLYGHLEGDEPRPVTMRMKVTVDNPATGDVYDATLTRELNSKFELRFKAEIAETGLQQIHDYIRQVAHGAGEYGDWWDEEVQDKVREVAFDDLPQEIQTLFQQVVQDQAEKNQDTGGDAMFGGEMPFMEILMDGEVVGYILNVDDYIDHPLWDGSGVHYYFDTFGTEVTSVYWSG